ncbi:MAG: CRISPR-associated ring nuclease [Caldilineaceae bacterium]
MTFANLPAVLVTTLGAEAPVVAISTQLLCLQGISLQAVEVLHTAPQHPAIRAALVQVQAAFAANADWPELLTTQLPMADVLAPGELDAFGDALFAVLRRWLRQGYQVHLLLAGGRKSMAMIGVTTAQLLFGPQDRLWYLYSDDELRTSGRHLLRSTDDARLVQIPLPPPLAAPVYGHALGAATPDEARSLLAKQVAELRRHFVEEELTGAERAVARCVVEDVATIQEIAARLGKSPKTVTNQLTSIYAKLEAIFGLQADVGVKREFLRRELGGYFGS